MSLELYILFGVAALAIAVATYFGGKHSAAKEKAHQAGETIGSMKATLEHVKTAVDRMGDDLRQAATKTEVQTLKDKLEAHIREEHSKI